MGIFAKHTSCRRSGERRVRGTACPGNGVSGERRVRGTARPGNAGVPPASSLTGASPSARRDFPPRNELRTRPGFVGGGGRRPPGDEAPRGRCASRGDAGTLREYGRPPHRRRRRHPQRTAREIFGPASVRDRFTPAGPRSGTWAGRNEGRRRGRAGPVCGRDARAPGAGVGASRRGAGVSRTFRPRTGRRDRLPGTPRSAGGGRCRCSARAG